MPDLLLELFSEEIPARMQAQAAQDLQRLVTDALVERGLLYEGCVAHVTPRRLCLHVVGLPVQQPDVSDVRKGPRVGAPQAAVDGFLKSAGLTSLDQATIENDPKKGDFYVAHIHKAGQRTQDVLAELLPPMLKAFPWPKSMRWGADSSHADALRWVRPLHSIVCTFGSETSEAEIIPFTLGGIASGNVTYGHRFMAPGAFKVRRFSDYVSSLMNARVVLDAARRRDIILHDAKNLAFAAGLELVEDEGLLAEVAGLTEWPVVLMGRFDEGFLEIPPEVIRATIRANQKCFVLRENESGKLANRFIMVSNLIASDGGKAIAEGNGRVVRARLSDAQFFWKSDLKVKLEDRLPRLEKIVFQEKLGTQAARVGRIMDLAGKLAPLVGADASEAMRAAKLAKADLVSEMVGEFPELQGLMGRYYALAQGESPAVATAIEDHYRPQGPADRAPNEAVAIAVALADKLDTLIGFWAIDEKPTGSKDPYALRRAALGIVRIVLESRLHLPLASLIAGHSKALCAACGLAANAEIAPSLVSFLQDRLKVWLRERGRAHDVLDAVFSTLQQDDILVMNELTDALSAFVATDDGKNLLAGYKRATNILRAEEKKDGAGAFDAHHAPSLRVEPEEDKLAAAVKRARETGAECMEAHDYVGAMRALSHLRAPVDAFFEAVTVNDPKPLVRRNRLQLLNELRQAMNQVADFSKIGG